MKMKNRWNYEYDSNGMTLRSGMKKSKTQLGLERLIAKTKTPTYEELEKEHREQKEEQEKERRMQHAILDIQKKYGKNAILKGMNFEEGAMTRERNGQIGGHKA